MKKLRDMADKIINAMEKMGCVGINHQYLGEYQNRHNYSIKFKNRRNINATNKQRNDTQCIKQDFWKFNQTVQDYG